MSKRKGKEHRRHRRYDVVDVRGSLVHHLDAKLLNLSLTGMAIETNAQLDVGGSYWLKVEHEDETIRFKADVKWGKLVRTEVGKGGEILPVYQAGIDYRQILDEGARKVLDFIESNIVVELDRRIFGRFKPREGSGVNLLGDHEFTVHSISLSGALIETDFGPKKEDIFELEIRAPTGEVDVKGRVASLIPLDWDDLEKGSKVGIEFLDLTPESRRLIETFIEFLIE